MFRKFLGKFLDIFSSSETNQRKRSVSEDSTVSEEVVSPTKRRRLEASRPMSDYSLKLTLDSKRSDRKREPHNQFSTSKGFMHSSDFVNNKSVKIFKGNTSPTSGQKTNIPTPARWIPAVPKSNGARKKVPVINVDDDEDKPSTPRGEMPKFPFAGRPSQGRRHSMFSSAHRGGQGRLTSATAQDDEVQVLESSIQKSGGLSFTSNPYNMPSRLNHSVRSSIFKSSSGSSMSSRINTNSLGSSALDYCDKIGAKWLYRQLIASAKPNGNRSGATSARPSAARDACKKLRDIPVLTIDADVDTRDVLKVNRTQEYIPTTLATKIADHGISIKPFSRSNSVEELLQTSQYYQDLSIMKKKYQEREAGIKEQMKEPTMRAKIYAEQNEKSHKTLEDSLREYCKLTEVTLKEVVVEVEPELPELTDAMESKIRAALVPHPRNELLVEAFSLRINRLDMQTLNGLNWLNDEVINLYMNLLIERGKEPGFPKAYAFNTFFYPRLLSGGHSALKRWTRKVDLFSYDLIIVPVHLGVHWCMSAIDFRTKQINYYDSMGAPNTKCLKQLLIYLEEESKDKLNRPFDTAGWSLLNVPDVPQQMNGSDCGMFACMYAEYICRDVKISFTQDNMPYFRRKMVYELLTTKLLPFK